MNREIHAAPLWRGLRALLMLTAILGYLTLSMLEGDRLPPSTPESAVFR